MAYDLQRVHLVGIGGAGMSGLAHILLSRGAVVSGSDLKDSRPVQTLRGRGAFIAVGHDAENLDLSGAEPTVVVTSFAAIPIDNPELTEAAARGIPVIRRSDLLAEIMADQKQVLIAGTHGKTSTTSMAVSALQAAGMDPSFAIGGQLNRSGVNAHNGSGEIFVAEADESDASLLRYDPSVAVVTNIEPDHLDFFHTAEAYHQVFDDFAARLGADGHLVVCLNDDNAAALGERAEVPTMGYGTTEACRAHPDVTVAAEIVAQRPVPEGTEVSVRTPAGEVSYVLSIPGEHMVLNSAAALVAGMLVGADAKKLAAGLSEFDGVQRRFQYYGTVGEVSVYDDYAHHPTEVTAVLTAAREKVQAAGEGRVVVCFQPHLYSRTMEFHGEFAQALSLADVAIVLDIFGAREQPVEGVSSRIISDDIDRGSTEVIYEPDFSAVPHLVSSLVKPGDVVITMGAGTVTLLAAEIVAALEHPDA